MSFGDPRGDCEQCDHPSGPHVLVATTDNDPMLGGIMLCPVPLCECLSTWSAPPELGGGKDKVFMPDEQFIDGLRKVIQS